MKTCRICNTEFEPRYNTMQKCCSVDCARDLVRLNRQKEYRKETNRRKKKLRLSDRSYQLKKAQEVFNAYIRKRDEKEPCISCGRHHQGQYHAGHFITVKSGGNALRYNELNCWKQCQPCNNHLSGNILEYRKNLIKHIGQKAVDWLEGPHAPQKLSIEDIKEIRAYYKQKLKELNDEKP